MYGYRVRPSGLTYNIVAENKGRFQVGHTRNLRGSDHPNWKGDQVGYDHLHDWVIANLGRPTVCEWCGSTEGRIEWANKSHQYLRDLTDWLPLCRFCHREHDSGENYGAAIAKWGPRYYDRRAAAS